MPGAYRQVLTMNMEPPRPKTKSEHLGFSCELAYIDWDFDAGGIQTGFHPANLEPKVPKHRSTECVRIFLVMVHTRELPQDL